NTESPGVPMAGFPVSGLPVAASRITVVVLEAPSNLSEKVTQRVSPSTLLKLTVGPVWVVVWLLSWEWIVTPLSGHPVGTSSMIGFTVNFLVVRIIWLSVAERGST